MRGVTRRLKQSWTPDGFARGCGEMSGEMPVELVEIRTGAEFTQPLRAFFNGFGRPDAHHIRFHTNNFEATEDS